MQSCRPI